MGEIDQPGKGAVSRKERRIPFAERNDLAGEHRWNDAAQVVLLTFFIAATVCDTWLFHLSDTFRNAVPRWARITAAVPVFILSLYLAQASLNKIFGQVRVELSVVRDGVYSVVRHPMYISAMLFYLGVLFLALSPLGLAVFIIIIVYYYFVCRYEEKLLIERLGGDYRRYLQEVPMWIPRLFRNKP